MGIGTKWVSERLLAMANNKEAALNEKEEIIEIRF
jgi:hypothetical protein